jgi:hypothetical protein
MLLDRDPSFSSWPTLAPNHLQHWSPPAALVERSVKSRCAAEENELPTFSLEWCSHRIRNRAELDKDSAGKDGSPLGNLVANKASAGLRFGIE